MLSFLFAGVIFLNPATQAGSDQRSREYSFSQGGHRYVIDAGSGAVSRTKLGGTRIEFFGSPAAGPSIPSPLPPHIIYYLLSGKNSISGLVWHDLNGDGVHDPAEPGMPNVSAYVDVDGSTTYTAGEPAGLTGVDGLYVINGIKIGTSNVFVDTTTLPPGYSVTTSQPLTVQLTPTARKANDVNFGAQDQSAQVSGKIWDQTADLPIEGVRIYVDLNNDTLHSAGEPFAITASSGSYVIGKVSPGTYNARVDNTTLNAKYHRTPAAGTNPTSVTLATGSTQTVNLAYLHKATICGTLRDYTGQAWGNLTIFIDLNNNGVYDTGEPTATTNAEGGYCFAELFPGTYTLLLKPGQLPAGYELLLPGAITVGAGEDGTANFLSYQPASISGFAWNDANGNQFRNAPEVGLENTPVFLDSNNNGVLDTGEKTTRTDAAGSFIFTGLVPGPYNIRVNDAALLREYNLTTKANPVFVTLASGEARDGVQFGYQRKLEVEHTPQYTNRLNWSPDGTTLYATDYLVNSVFIHDSALNITGELKNLAKPSAIIADSAGNIYVGNQGRNNVEVYDSFGNLIKTIGTGTISTPNSLALDRNNNLYILDGDRAAVLVYSQEGNLMATISDPANISSGVSIAIGYSGAPGTEVGALYIADQRKSTIHVYGLDGTYQQSMGSVGDMYSTVWDGKFAGLMSVAIDQYGNAHGLDNNLNVVQVFNPGGTFVRSYNAYLAENASAMNVQMDMAINPVDHRVVVANLATGNVETVTTVTAP